MIESLRLYTEWDDSMILSMDMLSSILPLVAGCRNGAWIRSYYVKKIIMYYLLSLLCLPAYPFIQTLPPPFRKAQAADCTNGESFFPLTLINITFEKKAYVEDIFKKRRKIKGII